MVPPKISLLKLTQGDTIKEMYEKYQIIQDMLIPFDKLSDALDVFHQELQVKKTYAKINIDIVVSSNSHEILLHNLYDCYCNFSKCNNETSCNLSSYLIFLQVKQILIFVLKSISFVPNL